MLIVAQSASALVFLAYGGVVGEAEAEAEISGV